MNSPDAKKPQRLSGFLFFEGTSRDALLVGLLFASFALFATIRSPIPGVNEPHYLCKARHTWDPAWCGRDLFLQSANAHAVYLWSIGAPTRVLTLEQTAWAGRIAVWLALAYGWSQLAAQLLPGAWSRLWSAWAFLALSAAVSFSGEWVVGGVEAKGFAYACVFVALAAACARNWRRAGVFGGLAVSFHPVVGGWALLASGIALAGQAIVRRAAGRGREADRPEQGEGAATATVPDRSEQLGGHRNRHWQALFYASLCALPGLIPAVGMLLAAPSADIARQADEIQVYTRLDHHLNPKAFPVSSYASYGGLLVAWLILRPYAGFSSAELFFLRFVLGAALIAVGGLAIGWLCDSPGLLKFYPFRLFDVALPVACAVTSAGLVCRFAATASEEHGFLSRARTFVACAPFAIGFVWSLWEPAIDRNPSGLRIDRWNNWVDACRWIEREVPADALFLTPRFNFAFKWYAQRAEYVAFKDCPQDAVNLVEWKRRLDTIQAWRQRHFERGFTRAAVAALHRETGIDYIIAWRVRYAGGKLEDPYLQEPVYTNASFAVYRAADAIVPQGEKS